MFCDRLAAARTPKTTTSDVIEVEALQSVELDGTETMELYRVVSNRASG